MSQDCYAVLMLYYHSITTLVALVWMMMVAVALFTQLVDYVHPAVEVTAPSDVVD